MARDYESYLERAQKLLAQGFHTKQGRKDAAQYTAHAFDLVREEFREARFKECGGTPWYNMPEAWRALEMPFTPAHWNAKRAKTLAAYPAIVERADRCAALRAQIMAAPEVPKPAPTRTPAQQAKDAKARTCQICARPIFAELGVIAHHGYERPGWGWQTASCPGARELPFEASRDRLLSHIAAMKPRLAGMVESLATVRREAGPVTRYYSREVPKQPGVKRWEKTQYTSHSVTFTRETLAAAVYFAAPAFEQYTGYCGVAPEGKVYWYDAPNREADLYELCLAAEIAGRESRIKSLREYIAWQEGRAKAWKLLERWDSARALWLIIPEGFGKESES